MNKLFIINLFLCFNSIAQFPDTLSSQLKINFVKYLINKNRIDDATFLLAHFDSTIYDKEICSLHLKTIFNSRREFVAEKLLNSYSKTQKDTLLMQCERTLLKNHFALMRRDSFGLLNPECYNHKTHKKAWMLQLMLFYLINKKYQDYLAIFELCKYNSDELYSNFNSINSIFSATEKVKIKRPYLAGLFSAFLPGAGKIYAGKSREGLTSTTIIVTNSAQAAEGFLKKGFQSPHFYVFGSITAFYYFTGIYGSIIAAKKKNLENKKQIELKIDDELFKVSKYYW